MDHNNPGYIRRSIKPAGHRGQPPTKTVPKLDNLIDSSVPARQPSAKRKAAKIGWLAILLVLIGIAVVSFTIYFAVFSSVGVKSHIEGTKAAKSAKKPIPKPNFTIYYPSGLPQNLTLNSSAIQYSLDSFGFPVYYSGKSGIYVSEQSAGADFSLKEFKSNLIKPIEFSTPVGPATQGTVGNNNVTAIQSSGQTLILINCSGGNFCATQSQLVAQAMQPNSSSSLFKH